MQTLSIHQLEVFVPAAVVMAFLPGQDMLFVVAQTASGGIRRGLLATVGTLTSFFVIHITAAALGLSALILHYAPLFRTIKYAGAIYLFYLGIRAFREARKPHVIEKQAPTRKVNGHQGAFLQGFLTNAFNPKISLFVLAFFPQVVIATQGHVALQIYLLGLIWGMAGFAALTIATLLSAQIAELRARKPLARQVEQYLSAAILWALGLRVAIVD